MARVKHIPASRKVGMSENERLTFVFFFFTSQNQTLIFSSLFNSKGKGKAKRASTSTPRVPSQQSPVTGSNTSFQQQEEPQAAAPQTQRKRKKHSKPGTVALHDIRRFQKSCELLIPAAPFIRCVKQITHQFSTEVTRWTPEAVVALQEAAEECLVHLFEDGMLCAIHARRITLSKFI
ncbi:hypothetical protein V8G54_017701 [Vigna mungo]|uniref:Core Histone H2A/H2B/H3 domain-containing protein n=1 Tax=Vigna mungo TaxID=3915 RepID=A0AAQ3S2A5_VIGMU